jgi:hypothetical protein
MISTDPDPRILATESRRPIRLRKTTDLLSTGLNRQFHFAGFRDVHRVCTSAEAEAPATTAPKLICGGFLTVLYRHVSAH